MGVSFSVEDGSFSFLLKGPGLSFWCLGRRVGIRLSGCRPQASGSQLNYTRRLDQEQGLVVKYIMAIDDAFDVFNYVYKHVHMSI